MLILTRHRTGSSFPSPCTGDLTNMDMAKGDRKNGQPKGTVPSEAANEPVIEGSGRPPAWDPFEVWRKRVRDVQDERSGRQPSAPD